MTLKVCFKTSVYSFLSLGFFLLAVSVSEATESPLKDRYFAPRADFYKILGVHKTATIAEIRKAGRMQLGLLHPDRNPVQPGEDPIYRDKLNRAFRIVSEALQVLGDEESRTKYDGFGSAASGSAARKKTAKQANQKVHVASNSKPLSDSIAEFKVTLFRAMKKNWPLHFSDPNMTGTETALLQKISNGDDSKFKKLVSLYSAELVRGNYELRYFFVQASIDNKLFASNLKSFANNLNFLRKEMQAGKRYNPQLQNSVDYLSRAMALLILRRAADRPAKKSFASAAVDTALVSGAALYNGEYELLTRANICKMALINDFEEERE